jgi:hypothetical protein
VASRARRQHHLASRNPICHSAPPSAPLPCSRGRPMANQKQIEANRRSPSPQSRSFLRMCFARFSLISRCLGIG